MKYFLIGFLLLWNVASSLAVVNYRTGNYFQEFTDVIFPMKGGSIFKFKRTYNSASDFEGMLGKGWGTTFETTVSILPNTVIIKEMGNGKSYLFVPKNSTVDKSLEESFKLLKEKNKLTDDRYIEYKNRLLADPQALEVELSSVVKNVKTVDGEYQNLSDPRQKVMIKGQRVDFWDSENARWSFDAAGSLQSWTDSNGITFNAQYNQNKLISLMSSLFFIQFERTPQGAIKAVHFDNKKVQYTMDKGFLIKSIDQNNVTYNYQYEQNKLTKISGKDFSEEVKYSLSTGEVASVTDSNGKLTSYRFSGSARPNPIRRAEIKVDGQAPSVFEYEDRVGKMGPYLYRRMIQKGSQKEQIIFDECCGRPLTVVNGDKKSEFKYNEQGLPLSLVEPDGTIHNWTWNEKNELIKYNNPSDERTYTYDAFGPILVVSSAKGAIALKRNSSGHIIESTITDKNGGKKLLRFGQSPDGKSTVLMNEKGQKAYLKESSPGNWEIDNSKVNDSKAKLDLLGWLHKYQDLAKAPNPQQLMPTF